ncbi:sialoadhesin-like [Enoplosus armatus]|uniref:sialoadhesin-like n=1 Tax=Enoplosus armatus TaxID=215367 RepID=UPI00399452B6
MGYTAVLCVNMVTANMLLSVFFLSGALAECLNKPVDLVITAPQKMEALSGSCVHIPCNFSARSKQEFGSSREIFGVWIKKSPIFGRSPENVIFNSSGTVKIYPMNITGNLSENNCTTLFSSLIPNYTDPYFLRITDWPFRATAVCDHVQINVTDSPRSPTIEISGDLKEEESVTITCSALTPCPHSPPQLTWNLQQDTNKIEENADRTFTTKIQATITLSDQHDGYSITCSARYPVNEGKAFKTAEERKTLSVSYAPKDTSASISPSGLVSAGSWVNLTCSSRAKPPVSRFSWFRISKDGPVTVSEGDFYSLNVTDGGVYYCVATNDLGNQTSPEIQLNIKVVISPTGPVSVGSVVNLTCSCRGSLPVLHFIWLMVSDGRLERIRVDTQVYGFKVTNSDRGRLYYCGCRTDLDIQLSTGHQLIFEGGQLVGVEVIVKTLGVIMLVSTLVIFECWFRSKRSTEPVKDSVDPDYVNTVTQSS